mgnify:CR=1 FL=1|tara:strand:- start:26 stop:334 length:309 start_codon:yes stop_codon:yes gene_type:complete
MQSTITTEFTPQQLTAHKTTKKTEQAYIFAILMNDRKIVVGITTNAPKRIAAINGGYHPKMGKSLCVKRIIGIKPVTEERTLPSVVAQFCREFGEDRITCME